MFENQELGTWSTDLGPLEMVPDEGIEPPTNHYEDPVLQNLNVFSYRSSFVARHIFKGSYSLID